MCVTSDIFGIVESCNDIEKLFKKEDKTLVHIHMQGAAASLYAQRLHVTCDGLPPPLFLIAIKRGAAVASCVLCAWVLLLCLVTGNHGERSVHVLECHGLGIGLSSCQRACVTLHIH
jgi:hypothetical protein